MKLESKEVPPHKVPAEFYNELAKAGVIPIERLRGIPMEMRLGDFCTCGHARAAHDMLGICRAKACLKFPNGCVTFQEDASRKIPERPPPGRIRKIPLHLPKEGRPSPP
jgi:hypothetical protein